MSQNAKKQKRVGNLASECEELKTLMKNRLVGL